MLEYACELASRVVGPHEGLPNQECLNSPLAQPRYMLGGKNPAFAHRDSRRGNPRRQSEGRFESGLEAAQVAIVDADQWGPELESEVELGASVNFGGHRHPQRGRARLQLPHSRRPARRDAGLKSI